ncbi:hypothetical protein [Rugamonas sp.]|uniref:hypothetical protein n=1 Tax=Rugamonas sp. TaxID=1926287 RepID=UPI0025EE64DC|nr:hypothetical protein [Rugamonas sp.]
MHMLRHNVVYFNLTAIAMHYTAARDFQTDPLRCSTLAIGGIAASHRKAIRPSASDTFNRLDPSPQARPHKRVGTAPRKRFPWLDPSRESNRQCGKVQTFAQAAAVGRREKTPTRSIPQEQA